MFTGPDEDKDFPVEILPYLFLGNAANSEDSEALSRHGIQYMLNVTPDLPNVFENDGSIKYMKIPICDHWSQNLASFFPQAIQFIGKYIIKLNQSLDKSPKRSLKLFYIHLVYRGS